MLEYIGIIALILTTLVAYNRYKAGWFLKDEDKKQSKFTKWWKNSRIYEIYVTNASQRKWLSFIPWFGLWISLFMIWWFASWINDSTSNPIQRFEELTKYEGKIIGYERHRKSKSVIALKLKDSSIKYFKSGVSTVDLDNHGINKNATIWIQNEYLISEGGNYEHVQWMEINGISVGIDGSYKDRFNRIRGYNQSSIENLTISIKWFIFFLALLWFINRKPVQLAIKNNTKKD